jgi:hypothetical protein
MNTATEHDLRPMVKAVVHDPETNDIIELYVLASNVWPGEDGLSVVFEWNKNHRMEVPEHYIEELGTAERLPLSMLGIHYKHADGTVQHISPNY